MSLHTPVKTPLHTEIRQGQLSWHLSFERITCDSKERCLVVGRLIKMCGLSTKMRSTEEVLEWVGPTCEGTGYST